MFIRKFVCFYRKLVFRSQVIFIDKYLVWITIGVFVVFYGFGDLLVQYLQLKKKKMVYMDILRLGKVVVVGFVIGLFIYYWYKYLDRIFFGRSMRIVIKKVVIDQVICFFIVIVLYLYIILIFEKKIISEINKEIMFKGVVLFVVELFVWFLVQYFSFFYFFIKYRGVYDNVILFGYDCLFSYVKFDLELGIKCVKKEIENLVNSVYIKDKLELYS